MVFWGDMMHVAAVQFENPAVTIQFDTDSKAAAVQRRKAYADAAKQGYLVGISHVSFPGIGRLRAGRGLCVGAGQLLDREMRDAGARNARRQ